MSTDIPSGASGSPSVAEELHLDRLPTERPHRATADLLRLNGRTAVVTGGGGDGLGHAVCHRLAEQGAAVAVVDVNLEAARHTAAQVANRWGTHTLAVHADVGSWAEVVAATDTIRQTLGPADVLVNNAGGSGGIGTDGQRVSTSVPLEAMSAAEMDAVVRVNLVGALYMTRAVVPGMIERRCRRVINVGTEGAKIGVAEASVYTACKAGLMSFTLSLARELGPRGVTSVCVSPGLMVRPAMVNVISQGGSLAESIRRMNETITVGRPAVCDDVASVIAFLASPAGEYVHGTTVSVGGGMAP